LVACAPYCFLRGPRPAGERGAAAALGADAAAGRASGCAAVLRQRCTARIGARPCGDACRTSLVLLRRLGHLRRRRPRRHICAHRISTACVRRLWRGRATYRPTASSLRRRDPLCRGGCVCADVEQPGRQAGQPHVVNPRRGTCLPPRAPWHSAPLSALPASFTQRATGQELPWYSFFLSCAHSLAPAPKPPASRPSLPSNACTSASQ
jgi:hypothetical protein